MAPSPSGKTLYKEGCAHYSATRQRGSWATNDGKSFKITGDLERYRGEAVIEMNGTSSGEAHRVVVRRAMYRLILIAMLVLLVVGCGASAQTKETKETKKTAERPNVVFILTDDLDSRLLASHLSAYPNIRNLAANGVTFENAFVTNALCCPSRSTILTGLYSHNHGVMTNTAPGGGASAFRPLEPTALPVWLRQRGLRHRIRRQVPQRVRWRLRPSRLGRVAGHRHRHWCGPRGRAEDRRLLQTGRHVREASRR